MTGILNTERLQGYARCEAKHQIKTCQTSPGLLWLKKSHHHCFSVSNQLLKLKTHQWLCELSPFLSTRASFVLLSRVLHNNLFLQELRSVSELQKKRASGTELHSSGQNLVGLHSISFIQVVTEAHLSTEHTESARYADTRSFPSLSRPTLWGEKAKEMKKKKGKLSELLLAQVYNFCLIENLQFFLCLHCPLKVSIATYNGLNAFKTVAA